MYSGCAIGPALRLRKRKTSSGKQLVDGDCIVIGFELLTLGSILTARHVISIE